MHIKLKKKHLFEIGSLVAVLTLNVGLYSILHQKTTEVNAYSSASLPTTINLNDCTDTEIRSYYSNLNSLGASERKGTNLLKNLKTILSNGQQYFNYDTGSTVWEMYEITDRDWVKSPASAISGYNPTTNTITGYTYHSSDPYLHALYINRDVENQTKAWADHTQNNWGINREHIWAKSHGFDTGGAGGARGDPMHLWAANGHVNNLHSNYFFAFVDRNRSPKESSYSFASDSFKGNPKNVSGSNATVFEPQDCDKGDIARAVFYMAARYNNYAGETSGFNSNNPNLVLANSLSENSRTGTSTATDPYAMGLLSDLLAWNKLDPVDEYEIHRNNLLYRNFSKNRNPFIDFPSWADAIWGTANNDGTNYNSTISTVANPATDAINSGSSTAVFSISSNNINLQVGSTADIYGMNAEGNISWTNSDSTVVSLNKNSTTNNVTVTITALKAGTATITATNGSNSETCTVTVTDGSSINYGTLENPLTVSEAIQVIKDTGDSEAPEMMYVKGKVTSASYNSDYSNFDHLWLESDVDQSPQAFDLFRSKLDSKVDSKYTSEDEIVGCEVVAYGYSKKYSTQTTSTYEMAPKNSVSPMILSVKPSTPVELTAKETIEGMDTNSILSYRYSKSEGDASVTDTLTKDLIGVGASSYTAWTGKTDVSGAVYAGKSIGTTSSTIQLNSNNKKPGIVTTSSSLNAVSVTVNWDSATAANQKLDVYGKNTPYTSEVDLYDDNSKGTLVGTATYDGEHNSSIVTISDEYKYIGLRSQSGVIYLTSIEIEWGGTATTYSYSDVSIRFGATIEKDLWNELDTEDSIEGFGVMITTEDFIEDLEIRDFASDASPAENNPDINSEIIDYYMPNTGDPSMPVPPEDGDDYVWNLFYRVTDLTKVYVAAAYIKTTTDVVFFREVRYSVKTLADDYIKNRGYAATIADGSLNNLANLKETNE